MNSLRAKLILILGSLWCSDSIDASSLYLSPGSVDIVMIAEVTDAIEDSFDGQVVYGLEGRPVHIFGDDKGKKQHFRVFQYGSLPTRHYATRLDGVGWFHSVGSILAISGKVAAPDHPGDINVPHLYGLRKIDPSCSVEDIIVGESDYQNWQTLCVDFWFEATKDIARLMVGAEKSNIEILIRLANYKYPFDYKSLVQEYVEDPNSAESLLSLRHTTVELLRQKLVLRRKLDRQVRQN